MKAYQRAIREQLIGADVLAGVWLGTALDLATAVVRPITYAEARALIEQYEPMPAVTSFCYGLFFGEQLGGAVVYGNEYGENLHVWDGYGFSGKLIGLLRGCSAYGAPKNSASFLIRRSMKQLPEQFKVVTATVDRRAGENGDIYQACSFHYVGLMTHGTRLQVYDGVRTISERTARRRYGTAHMGVLEGLGNTVERVPRRGRYFAFRGSHRERKALRAAIADRIQPYPKRSSAVVIKLRVGGKFAGTPPTRVGGKTASVGFIKTRRRQLKNGGISMTFDLLRSVRIEGRPRHKSVMTIGTQRSDRDLDGARFWKRAIARMIAHGLSAPQRQRLVGELIRKGAQHKG